MTDRELMQMALDALEEAKENVMDWGSYASEYFKTKHGLAQDILAIENISEALRARLVQPEPEPVATLFGSLHVYDVPPAKPVAWVENLENARPHCVTDLKYCSVAQHERGEHLKYIPLYTAPPQREWQGLTDEEANELTYASIAEIDAKLKEKNYG